MRRCPRIWWEKLDLAAAPPYAIPSYPMALSSERLRSIIESMLLVSAEPLPLSRIVEVLEGEDRNVDPETVRAAVNQLLDLYAKPDRKVGGGFRVEEVAGGLQMRTTPENAHYLRRLLAVRPARLTRAALETLAIIAYRQPVTKPEIEAIRGVDVSAVLKALLEREFIRILGKRDEVGRPLLYGTAPTFLELFGLKSLAALPTLREYTDLDDAHTAEVDALYEPENQPLVSDLASAAEFLNERHHDPDLDALDDAVIRADQAGKAAEAVLDPAKAEAQAPADGKAATEGEAAPAPKTDGATAAPASEAAPDPSKKAPESSSEAPESSNEAAAPESP